LASVRANVAVEAMEKPPASVERDRIIFNVMITGVHFHDVLLWVFATLRPDIL